MRDYKSTLEPDFYYHIYNRANGSEKLFLNEDNYSYFLQKYNFYISPIAHSFAYCLMPNHFHFVIRIKSFSQTSDVSKTSDVLNPIEAFRRLLMSYTKAFNKQNNRKGSLFTPKFNRIKITSEEYLKNTINYIHQNPVIHGYVKELDEWRYSSYTSLLNDKSTKLNRQDVLYLFNDLNNFVDYHNLKRAEQLALEMDLSY